MQENIIGYLLGALDDDEMAQFEAELDCNEDLQLRVQDAARSLQILNHDAEDEEPPSGLVEATCRQVRTLGATPTRQGHERHVHAHHRQLVHTDESWSIFDVIVAASVLFVGCFLFLPAINSSRMHSQVAGCQDNLRHIGRALIEYSQHNSTRSFPQIPNSKTLGVAGIYAPILMGDGFITEDHRFHCPSSPRFAVDAKLCIPLIEEIAAAHGPELRQFQERMGGDYGYSLGYMFNGEARSIRNKSRTSFAIMTDSPLCESQPVHHNLMHRNVLFECGGVRVVPINLQEWKGDKLFEDAHGRLQAGVDQNDTVIGGSATPPLPRF